MYYACFQKDSHHKFWKQLDSTYEYICLLIIYIKYPKEFHFGKIYAAAIKTKLKVNEGR